MTGSRAGGGVSQPRTAVQYEPQQVGAARKESGSGEGAAWQKQPSSEGWARRPLARPYLSLSFSSMNSWSIP